MSGTRYTITAAEFAKLEQLALMASPESEERLRCINKKFEITESESLFSITAEDLLEVLIKAKGPPSLVLNSSVREDKEVEMWLASVAVQATLGAEVDKQGIYLVEQDGREVKMGRSKEGHGVFQREEVTIPKGPIEQKLLKELEETIPREFIGQDFLKKLDEIFPPDEEPPVSPERPASPAPSELSGLSELPPAARKFSDVSDLSEEDRAFDPVELLPLKAVKVDFMPDPTAENPQRALIYLEPVRLDQMEREDLEKDVKDLEDFKAVSPLTYHTKSSGEVVAISVDLPPGKGLSALESWNPLITNLETALLDLADTAYRPCLPVKKVSWKKNEPAGFVLSIAALDPRFTSENPSFARTSALIRAKLNASQLDFVCDPDGKELTGITVTPKPGQSLDASLAQLSQIAESTTGDPLFHSLALELSTFQYEVFYAAQTWKDVSALMSVEENRYFVTVQVPCEEGQVLERSNALKVHFGADLLGGVEKVRGADGRESLEFRLNLGDEATYQANFRRKITTLWPHLPCALPSALVSEPKEEKPAPVSEKEAEPNFSSSGISVTISTIPLSSPRSVIQRKKDPEPLSPPLDPQVTYQPATGFAQSWKVLEDEDIEEACERMRSEYEAPPPSLSFNHAGS